MSDEPLVHIIDDDEAVRGAMLFLLQTASISACTYTSAIEFLAAQPAPSRGCIVTDVRMPEMSGFDLLRRLRADGQNLPVIVITGDGDIPAATEAIRAGAFDFIEKPFEDEVLISAICAALDPRGARQADLARRAEISERLSALTAQEREVLNRILAGQQNDNIARELTMSLRAVETHRANVMSKLDAKRLSDVVRKALMTGGVLHLRPE